MSTTTKTAMLLILGTIVFASGYAPVLATNLQTPTQTYSTTTVDGVRIAFDITMKPGTSGSTPIALLIHGFSGNKVMMRMIAYSLADRGFICVSLDLRGHGSSEGMMPGFADMSGFSAFDNDVTAVVQFLQTNSLGNTSNIVMLGHSMGGGVTLDYASKTANIVAAIGVAPYASPSSVNTTMPRNLLLIISTGDQIINNTSVREAFYTSINGTGLPNTIYSPYGTKRELFIVEGPDHLSMLYSSVVISEITKWATSNAFGVEQVAAVNTDLLGIGMYVALAGGIIMILAAAALVHMRLWGRERKTEAPKETELRNLAILGVESIVIAGVFGSFLALLLAFVLIMATPLFLTDFVTALFLGNALVFGFIASMKLKKTKKNFSYFRFLKESIVRSSLKADLVIGTMTALAFLALLVLTMGGVTSSTFSTASLRLILLPLYILVFALDFMFYESFFKGAARPMMSDGPKRMAKSVIYEFLVLMGAVLLELVIVASMLGLFMPFIGLSFLLLGLPMMLIPMIIGVFTSEVFYERTGGWIAQIVVGAVVFASLTIVFSPVLKFF